MQLCPHARPRSEGLCWAQLKDRHNASEARNQGTEGLRVLETGSLERVKWQVRPRRQGIGGHGPLQLRPTRPGQSAQPWSPGLPIGAIASPEAAASSYYPRTAEEPGCSGSWLQGVPGESDVIPACRGGNLGNETKRHLTAAQPQISNERCQACLAPTHEPQGSALLFRAQEELAARAAFPSPSPARSCSLGVGLVRKQRTLADALGALPPGWRSRCFPNRLTSSLGFRVPGGWGGQAAAGRAVSFLTKPGLSRPS